MTKHAKISFLKSLTRIVGYLTLLIQPVTGVGLLIFAEILGIVEEL
jgi:hypothetical protein